MYKLTLVAQTVKNLPATYKTRVWTLGQEDPLEKGMATHSSILAWRTPWTEEPGGLQSMGSQRVGQDWATITFTKGESVFKKDNAQFLWAQRTKKILSSSSLGWGTTNWGPVAVEAWSDGVIRLLRACEKVEDTRLQGGGMGCCRLWREIETWDGGGGRGSERWGVWELPTPLPSPSASTPKHTGCRLSLCLLTCISLLITRIPTPPTSPYLSFLQKKIFLFFIFIFCFFLFQLLATKTVGLTNPMPWIPLAIRTINMASPIHQWLSQANTTSSTFQGRFRSHF